MSHTLHSPTISICIATFKRAAYIAETLEAIVGGLPDGVEVVILDGGSPDNTKEVVEPFVRRSAAVRYFREATNSGVDRDFDKAVEYASGNYCWLMSDDDILVPGAIARVLEMLEQSPDLVVVNAEMRNADLSVQLNPGILGFKENRSYDLETSERFLAEVGDYLSFIGGVVIRRALWLERDRERYFGSLFIHVGVIFQAPIRRVMVLAEPLILIRYGNAMWTNRLFEIWMFMWPELIWSFHDFSNLSKGQVIAREPWRQWKRLTLYRAMGAYSAADHRRFFRDRNRGGALQWVITLIPPAVANSLIAAWWYFTNPRARAGIYDLARSAKSSRLTRSLARRLKIPLR